MPLDTSRAAGNTGHISDSNKLAKFHNRFFHVEDYGAVGDGSTNDAAAIQAAIDDASTRAGGASGVPRSSGVVHFGPGGNYRITTPLTLKRGVTLRGMMGRRNTASSPSQITYAGTATALGVFNYEGLVGDQNVQWIGVEYLRVNAETLADFCFNFPADQPKVDFGTHFTHCQFTGANKAFIFTGKGTTDLHIDQCRTDGKAEHAFWFKAPPTGNAACDFATIQRTTFDTTTNAWKSVIHIDYSAVTDVNSPVSRLDFSHSRVELNNAMDTADQGGALFLVSLPATDTGGKMLAKIHSDDVLVATPTIGINGHAILKQRRGTAAPSPAVDYVSLVATGLSPRTQHLVVNAATPVVMPGNRDIANFTYAPWSGSPATERTQAVFAVPLIIGNVPSVPETPPAGHVVLYAEAGVLKYKNDAGTVRTITVT